LQANVKNKVLTEQTFKDLMKDFLEKIDKTDKKFKVESRMLWYPNMDGFRLNLDVIFEKK